MKPALHLLWVAVLAASCSGNPTEQSTVAMGEWQTIFNGENLDGWETMGLLETKVEDGALHIHATDPNNNAWVLTTASYDNFKLECEFYMPDTMANSGVLIRFDPAVEGTPNATAYEANIDWRTNHQNTLGTLENAARAKVPENADPNGWNKMLIVADGNYFQVFINGEMVCETHNNRRQSGRIGLQVPIRQGDDIAFRNLRLQELPETGEVPMLVEDRYRQSDRPMKNLLNEGTFEGWYTIGPGTWDFQGEVIHGISGDVHSYLVSEETFRNFYLKCQFKIAKEENSGIFIRKHPDSTAVNIEDAIECNIYDHNGYDHAYSTGSIVTRARAWANMIDYEDWNEMEIFAEDELIVLFINGKKSAEINMPASFNKAGNICLQAGTRALSDNGPSDVYFKELMIRSMD